MELLLDSQGQIIDGLCYSTSAISALQVETFVFCNMEIEVRY